MSPSYLNCLFCYCQFGRGTLGSFHSSPLFFPDIFGCTVFIFSLSSSLFRISQFPAASACNDMLGTGRGVLACRRTGGGGCCSKVCSGRMIRTWNLLSPGIRTVEGDITPKGGGVSQQLCFQPWTPPCPFFAFYFLSSHPDGSWMAKILPFNSTKMGNKNRKQWQQWAERGMRISNFVQLFFLHRRQSVLVFLPPPPPRFDPQLGPVPAGLCGGPFSSQASL